MLKNQMQEKNFNKSQSGEKSILSSKERRYNKADFFMETMNARRQLLLIVSPNKTVTSHKLQCDCI